jgi:hypothetical protein
MQPSYTLGKRFYVVNVNQCMIMIRKHALGGYLRTLLLEALE